VYTSHTSGYTAGTPPYLRIYSGYTSLLHRVVMRRTVLPVLLGYEAHRALLSPCFEVHNEAQRALLSSCFTGVTRRRVLPVLPVLVMNGRLFVQHSQQRSNDRKEQDLCAETLTIGIYLGLSLRLSDHSLFLTRRAEGLCADGPTNGNRIINLRYPRGSHPGDSSPLSPGLSHTATHSSER